MPAMINCPYCGKLTDPKLANCPHCGGPMQPRGSAPPRRGGAKPDQHCPSCGTVVHDGEIICVRCGTNLLTGHKIAEEQKISQVRERRRWPLYVALAVVVIALGVVATQLPELLKGPVAKARELALSGRDLEATNVLRQYLSSHPDDAAGQFLFGQLRWGQNDFAEAAQAFEESFRSNTANLDAAWAAVAALRKQPGQAAAQRQIELLRRLTDTSPDNARAWRLLASALAEIGDIEGQATALERAVALDPGDSASKLQQGIVQARRGQLENAQASLQAAVDLGAEDAVMAKAILAGMSGESDEVVALLESAVAQGENDDSTRTRLALSYMARGEFQKAEELLRGLSPEVRRENVEAAFARALCLHALEQPAQATDLYTRIVDLNGPRAQEAALLLAEILVNQKNFDRARQLFSTAQTISQSSAGAGGMSRNRLNAMMDTIEGRLLVNEGQIERAMELFARAAEADSSYPAAALELGLNYIQRGDMPRGVAELERYLELTGPNAGGQNQEIELLVRQLRETANSEQAVRPPGVSANESGSAS